MLTDGDIDVLTGDYLAELTMLILAMGRLKDPSRGYASTSVRQMEECLGLAIDAGVKVVVNAGGLNPAGLADRLRDVADNLGDGVSSNARFDPQAKALGEWLGSRHVSIPEVLL